MMTRSMHVAALVVVAIALAVTACKGKGTAEGNKAIEDTRALVDKICASTCSERPCAEALAQELIDLGERLENTYGTEEQEQKIIDMIPRAERCMDALIERVPE